MKTVYAIAAAVLMSSLSQGANASHSTYNPMAPRQISVDASQKDYSYGLTVLPGNSIDSLDPFFRYVGWYPNYYVLDRYILRPVAHGYAKLPETVKLGVGNFFNNISDINNTVNNMVVGDPASSGVSLSRLMLNSTVGMLGLFDIASRVGLDYRPMKMDTVMGKAGFDQGMYMMLPVLGPYTERSAHGELIDSWPYAFVGEPIVSALLWSLKTVHNRAELIPQEEMIDKAFDPYVQTRQVFLMYTEGKVNPDAALQSDSEDQNVDDFLDEIDDVE